MSRFKLEVGSATDVGRQRQDNQDRYAVWLRGRGESSELSALLLVADGMGGERGGAMASQTAVDRILEWLTSGHYRTWPEYNGSYDFRDVLRRALRDVSSEIYEIGVSDENLRGLGSTAVLAAYSRDRVTVAHVGDSRCYLVRDGAIRRLTDDHTWVEEQVGAGFLSVEQARVHPQRNVLTRSLGDSEVPEVDVRTEPLEDRDVLVLCSDGLTGGVSDQEILDEVRRHPDPRQAAEALVDLANEKDGSDNVTVVVARCEDLDAARFRHRGADPEDTQPLERPPGIGPRQPAAAWRGWALAAAASLLTLLFAYLAVRVYAAWRFQLSVDHYQNGEYLHSRQELRKILEISLDAEKSEKTMEMIRDFARAEEAERAAGERPPERDEDPP